MSGSRTSAEGSTSAPELPPGPKGRLLLGSLPDFARDILGFLTARVRDYGDFVRFRIPGYEVYLLQRPEDIETVLLTERTNFIRHRFFWRHVTAIFGNGLLTSEGEFWLAQRRLAAPAFHPERIAAYGSVMAAFADRSAAGWRDGEVRDIQRDMMQVTMKIVSKTLFDVEVQGEVDQIGRAFDQIIYEIARRFRRPFRPERWLDGSTSRLPRYVYIPFGGGPRICIGERFATMEAVLVLATLLRRFRFEMADPNPIPFPSITLRPQGGPILRLVRRTPPD